MQVIDTPNDILRYSREIKGQHKRIGLVPTMGALHAGHMALVEQSLQENDFTIASLFVNPLQFNSEEDLKAYPRDLHTDLSMLEKAGVDFVYAPSENSMYETTPMVSVDFGPLGVRMEGAYRPGHFKGVGVVVSKLFHHCEPDVAYFGLKDLQQFLLIRKMAHDLSFPVKVVGHPIIREASGLAMSSRNQRLSSQGLVISANLYKGLLIAKSTWDNKGAPNETKIAVNDFYKGIDGLEIEYFHIVEPETLIDVESNNHQSVAFCVAGYVEGIRLIDNLYLRQD